MAKITFNDELFDAKLSFFPTALIKVSFEERSMTSSPAIDTLSFAVTDIFLVCEKYKLSVSEKP